MLLLWLYVGCAVAELWQHDSPAAALWYAAAFIAALLVSRRVASRIEKESRAGIVALLVAAGVIIVVGHCIHMLSMWAFGDFVVLSLMVAWARLRKNPSLAC